MPERGAFKMRKLPLTAELILAWADDHRAHTGKLPTADSGPVPAAPDENWTAINQALRQGCAACRAGIPWPACCCASAATAIAPTCRG